MPGMMKESVVLIDGIVALECNASWRATLGDMTMEVTLCGMERTEGEWRVLAYEAGFNMLKILQYEEEVSDSVMVLTLI